MKMAHQIKVFSTKTAVMVGAVLTLVFTFMATDMGEKVTAKIFASRDGEIKAIVTEALAERDASRAQGKRP